MSNEIYGQISQISMELRLPTFRNNLESVLARAFKSKKTYEQLILELLQAERETRTVNRKKAQLRNAGFPQMKHLQDLDPSELPEDAAQKLPILETLDFIEEGRNVILGGSPGTGKTHIAIGLGIKACQAGRTVLFTTVSRLLTQIRESHSSRTLRGLESKFEKYDLVVCDDDGASKKIFIINN